MATPKTNTATYKKLADYLQQQRRNKRFSIRKISQLTSLPESTIRALENPNKSELNTANLRGLYETYGEALNVTPRRIQDLAGEPEEVKISFSIKRLEKLKSLIVFSNIGASIATLAILLLVLSYAGWQGRGLFSSPELMMSFPDKEYVVVDEPSIEVRGTAPTESTVLINGEPTTVDGATGEFSQTVFLQAGYNQVTVEAVNNFATKTIKSFTVVYEPRTKLGLKTD
jgi:hypothetical protein